MQPHFNTVVLSHERATQYLKDLTRLANLIPAVEYQPADIITERKDARQFHNKWDHSLIVLDGDTLVAFVMGYERRAEDNEQYPENTLYISELAVAKTYQGQGVGRSLLGEFFRQNNDLGFLTLTGELCYSVQTNSAEWNNPVINLYKSFGFEQRALKHYPNRIDVVLGAAASSLVL